jgi:hypothetical protein
MQHYFDDISLSRAGAWVWLIDPKPGARQYNGVWEKRMAGFSEWLIDETKPLTEAHLEELDRELADVGPTSRGGQELPPLAVSLHDIVIHDNKKWFGEAAIRLDALIITGHGRHDAPRSFYMPKTVSFGRVRDGDRLSIGTGGLLVFHGQVMHFLDIFLMVSRDRKDTQDLAGILTEKLGSEEMQGAVAVLLGLAVAAPPVAAVAAAMSAAAVLGDFAYRLLQTATGATIGLYRNSHLQFRDGFGIGRHPGPGDRCYRANDLSFRYEIALEQDPSLRTGT